MALKLLGSLALSMLQISLSHPFFISGIAFRYQFIGALGSVMDYIPYGNEIWKKLQPYVSQFNGVPSRFNGIFYPVVQLWEKFSKSQSMSYLKGLWNDTFNTTQPSSIPGFDLIKQKYNEVAKEGLYNVLNRLIGLDSITEYLGQSQVGKFLKQKLNSFTSYDWGAMLKKIPGVQWAIDKVGGIYQSIKNGKHMDLLPQGVKEYFQPQPEPEPSWIPGYDWAKSQYDHYFGQKPKEIAWYEKPGKFISDAGEFISDKTQEILGRPRKK